ncbi:MAG: copper amine oxidase N-terminal domain-containing protein [Clostridia bacterium]|nr:copper amine oxidase N-terminal domain-containing protein [Clostridia bacterium]
MKKIIIAAVTALMLTTPAMADENVTVYSNGNLVADKGIIIDGRTMVPVRGVFEYMGYDVEWDANTKTAVLTNSDKETVIKLTNGESSFTVNDNVITPDVPQQIIEGRFMLPLRAVGEAVDAKVNWDNENKTAYIDADSTDEASEKTENNSNDNEFTPEKKTETIGNTTITSEINVPFIRIEGIDPNEAPEGTKEIEIQ